MPIQTKDIKRFSAIILIVALFIAVFYLLRPIALSIIAGLLLAYAFLPIYKRTYRIVREKNTAALAVGILVVLVIFIPLWFAIPLIIQQISDMFLFLQALDVSSFVQKVLPGLSTQLQVDITTTIVSFLGKITTASLGALTNLLFNLPTVLLHAAVIIFVFYFTMRDSDKLKAFALEISPLRKEKQAVLVTQFRDITSSLVYGQIIIGIVQGIATGIGLLIFGVPRALLLTLFAVGASILPLIGPWLIWIPAAIYLFTASTTGAAIGFSIYSLLVVSTIDNFLRPYIVARKTKSSSVFVLIGMIGGLLTFGILGLVLGPLILQYAILFLEAYKNKALAEMFASD